MTRVLGIDLALNHSGFVELDDSGKMKWWMFVSDVAKHSADKPCVNRPDGSLTSGGRFMPHKKQPDKDREHVNASRLAWWQLTLLEVMTKRKPTHVGIEDYAISADSNSAYQIGEVGGAARLAAIEAGALLRLHDPMSVKMYGAFIGNAQPETVMMAVRERWPETQVWDSLAMVPKIDLACAYVVAQMVHAEIQLRSGKMALHELGHEKMIAVFQRTTKANPISLLGREWISI